MTLILNQTSVEAVGSEAILLVDRHLMVAGAMAAYLEQNLRVNCTLVTTLDDALHEILRHGRFSLVLVDINSCPEIDCAEVGAILQANGSRSVGLISDMALDRKTRSLLNLDIRGVVLKSMSAQSVANVIRFMLIGESFFPPALASSPPPSDKTGKDEITPTQAEILVQLAHGHCNRDIARITGKSEATVKMHVTALLRKLKASNRTMAVVLARELRLI